MEDMSWPGIEDMSCAGSVGAPVGAEDAAAGPGPASTADAEGAGGGAAAQNGAAAATMNARPMRIAPCIAEV